ncbi:hypothetical protein AND_003186 [Anopheles darlingi]|uniref:Serum response factor-binding protein 1 n=1 Tax=Anopheles darlingi TaxID=43151 RepID=W5JQM6_ANODA|nr:hypothetical protein AND_003186 [Anopheles darlingi]
MGNKALRLEVSKLRTLVKKTRTNIIRKLLRDRKLWAGKVEASSGNRRATKKLETAEALSKHIKTLGTSQLVKDVIRFQLRKDAAGEQQLTAVSDRAIARFYAEPKVVASVRVLIDRFELQKDEALIDVAVKDGQKEAKDASSEAKGPKKKKKTKPKRAKGEKATPKVAKNGKQKATKKGKGKAKAEDEDELSDTQDNEEPSDVSVSMSEDEDSILDEEEEQEEDETPSKPTKNASEPKPKPAVKEKKKSKEPKMKMPANLKPPEDDDEEEGCLMVQDSFFVTESGTNYVAVAPVLKKSEGDSDEDNIDAEEEEESWKFSVKRRKKQEQRNAAQGKVPDGGKPSRNGKFESNKRSFASSNEPVKRFRRDSGQTTEPDAGLHPSWAAKQRQKVIIPFAGKKVVFDDAGANPVSSEPTKAKDDLHPSWAAKQAQKGIKPFAGKKVVFDDGESTSVPAVKSTAANDLHPSWAAKQAQKGIKTFAGKKTVFDHREDTSAPPTNLHPSWAAKQAQKGIKPFAGKKKVFDDNDGEGKRHQELKRAENTTNTEGLHPSWAAKQAQKGLKPFAGKKITFGDDEIATPVYANRSTSGSRAAAKTQPTAISSDLHPSWAAKQAQKGIKQFEGKKISFDD